MTYSLIFWTNQVEKPQVLTNSVQIAVKQVKLLKLYFASQWTIVISVLNEWKHKYVVSTSKRFSTDLQYFLIVPDRKWRALTC